MVGAVIAGNLIQTSQEFAERFEPPDYLIDGLIQRRYIYSLTAPTGGGKTAVVMRLAAHCTRGLKLDDREVDKCRVLFFAGENPDDVRMRWIKQCEEMGDGPSKMDVSFCLALPRYQMRKYATGLTLKQESTARSAC